MSKSIPGFGDHRYRTAVALCLVLASAWPPVAEGGDRLSIYAVNHPLAYFTERIAGEYADVVFPAPPDLDPAFWMPDSAAIAGYQQADLIILNGATYAKWLNKVSLPRFRMLNTSRAFRDEYIGIEGTTTHSHGPAGEHSHAGTAFTTWLDLDQAALQAGAIRDALVRKLPDRREDLDANYEALEKDLADLSLSIEAAVALKPDQPLVASHPIYQYFARRYGLDLKSVTWEPGEFPPEEEWKALAVLLEKHSAGWMIWEGEPLPESVKRLESMGVRSLVFDPCANRPEQGDFMSTMKGNVENLRAAFGGESNRGKEDK
jgi:zinc transport system substrate-binding protein